METCTVETGLLKKKPCGNNMVTRCANCEQPLCKGHAVAQKNEAGKSSGKFMCKECDAARKEFEKNAPPAPAPKKPAEAPKPAAGAPAAAPAAAAKPAAAPAAATAAANKMDESGPIEFTPTKK